MASAEKEIRVVITDDSINDHYFIKKALSDHNNVHITSLYDGEELISYLLKQEKYAGSDRQIPHIVLLDVNMPRLSGIETLQQLDEHPELKEIHFVILSSYFDNQTFQSKNLKVEFYNKPMTLQGYRDILDKIIETAMNIKV